MEIEVDGRGLADQYGLGAFLIYLAFSILFFGRTLFGHFSTLSIGQSSDPGASMWWLVWVPYAITHRINPFFTSLVWAPIGGSLAWKTFMPLVDLAAWPITGIYGPIVAYNILCVLAPPLAGWTTFLLCRYITKRYWPSLVGGYIFAFSTYMLCQTSAHLGLTLIFLIPFAVYLVLRRISNDIGPRRFAILFALFLTVQFLIRSDPLAMLTLFGGIAMLLAFVLATAELRQRLYATFLGLSAGYALALLLLSPYLYFMFGFGGSSGPIWPKSIYSADLANFSIPTRVNLCGEFGGFEAIARTFSANISEASAYLSPGLVMIAILFARARWREPVGKLLILMLVIVCVASLGGVVHFAGSALCPLPWRRFFHLPLIEKALPVRFTMYAFLDLAVMAALWLSTTPARAGLRLAVAIVSLALMLPNLDAGFWVRPVNLPAFFSTGLYRQYLRENEVVLPLPVSGNDSMLWQAEAGMYFRIADGYMGPDPSGFKRWEPKERGQLLEFLASHDVSTIIVSRWAWRMESAGGPRSWILAPVSPELWRLYLSELKTNPLQVADVTLYRVPPEQLAPYRKSPNAANSRLPQ